MGQPNNALQKALRGITPAVDQDLVDDLFNFELVVSFAAVTGTNAIAETWAHRVKQRSRLIAAYFIGDAAITANATNYASFLIDKGPAAGGARVNVVAFALDTPTTDDVAQGTPKALATYFTATDADLTFAEGDTITTEVTKTGGSGLNTPISKIVLVFKPLDDA